MIVRLMQALAAVAAWGAIASSMAQDGGRAFTIYVEGPRTTVIDLHKADDGKLFLTATVQGTEVLMLLDTGATTVLDTGVASRAPWGLS